MYNDLGNPDSGKVQEDESEDGPENDEIDEGPPHDVIRCEAGHKGICGKCGRIRRRQQRLI